MIRLALAAPSAMLLAGLEALVMRDGAFTVVERIAHLDDVAETLEGADVDVVVAVVDAPARFALPTASEGDPVAQRWVLLLDAEAGAVGDWVRRGARAVLPRDAEGGEILAAIEAVHSGLAVVPASVAEALTGRSTRAAPRLAGTTALAPLSPREREILALLAEGLGNKIAAARLGISEHTVKTHVASIFQKLGADTRAEAVAIGARTGMILL
ncbi:MAG: response regulator transcription factor [Gemmatimonadota bacterium]